MIRKITRGIGRAIQETGQALDRAGLRALGSSVFEEKFSRHRQVMNIGDKRPSIYSDSWVAPNATIIGDVEVSNDASIWYGCVVRGDVNPVKIGFQTNVQDRTVIHSSSDAAPGMAPGTTIGSSVTIGHGCTLYSCTIEDQCLIGIGSVVLDGALVEKNCILAAGTVVPPGRRIPSGQMWAGNPAKYVRDVNEDEIQDDILASALKYKKLATTHSDEFLPYGTVYLDAERVKVQG